MPIVDLILCVVISTRNMYHFISGILQATLAITMKNVEIVVVTHVAPAIALNEQFFQIYYLCHYSK